MTLDDSLNPLHAPQTSMVAELSHDTRRTMLKQKNPKKISMTQNIFDEFWAIVGDDEGRQGQKSLRWCHLHMYEA